MWRNTILVMSEPLNRLGMHSMPHLDNPFPALYRARALPHRLDKLPGLGMPVKE
jgi:hypothetical protein